MPMKPAKICRKVACNALTTDKSGYCEAHKLQNKQEFRQRMDSNRLPKHKRGYNHKWEKARKEFLLDNPYCAECMRQGMTVPATTVDHIIPHRGNMILFWDQSNWQSMCTDHHNAKTRKGL